MREAAWRALVCVAAASPVAHHGRVKPRTSLVWTVWALLGASACERWGPHGETGSDTGAESDVPEVCLQFVACMQEFDPEQGAMAAANYGESGSCWGRDELAQAECLAICDEQLRLYGEAFPALASCDASKIVTDVEFEIGEAAFDPVDPLLDPVWRPVEQGGTLTIVRGGQGLLMLPLALRGRNFVITEDPTDWDNPKIPKVDLTVDIEGFNVGFGGHFARLNNYAVGFEETATPGLFEHMYIAVIVPDAISDPTKLTNQPGKVRIALRTFNKPSAVRELDFVVAPKIQEY